MCQSTVASLAMHFRNILGQGKQLYWKEGPSLSLNHFTFTQNTIVVSVNFLRSSPTYRKLVKDSRKKNPNPTNKHYTNKRNGVRRMCETYCMVLKVSDSCTFKSLRL